MDVSNVTVTGADGKTLSGVTAGIHGNMIQVNLPTQAKASVDLTGKVTSEFIGKASVSSYSFHQEVVDCTKTAVYGHLGHSSHKPAYPCGQYMGKTGPLHTNIKGVNVASDGSSVELQVAYPGQTGFCGGYWSPLMVFFDDERPEFNQTSAFPLNPFGKTHWPEAGHAGYFLAVDSDGDGKIAMSEELFGDAGGKHANGFEALRAFDSNGDGAITPADRDFNRLVLWQDKNGDGVSQKDEMVPLKAKGISKISLKYNKVLRPLGRNAEEREMAEFHYKSGKRSAKGHVIDVWLAPAAPEERATASEKK